MNEIDEKNNKIKLFVFQFGWDFHGWSQFCVMAKNKAHAKELLEKYLLENSEKFHEEQIYHLEYRKEAIFNSVKELDRSVYFNYGCDC